MVYASAGMVTTREFIVMAAWHLFERDDLRQRFVSGDDEAQLAILEEILRLEPVAGLLYRRATEAVAGTEGGDVDAGALLIIDVRAANADAAAVGACPYAIDPDRSSQAKATGSFLSFGDGPHRCPGAQVALHETRVFLDRLMRLPGVRLVREPTMTWNDALMSYELRGATVACDRAWPAPGSPAWRIRLAAEVLIQRLSEQRLAGRSFGEEAEAGAEFQVVGAAEDLARRAVLDGRHRRHAFAQPRAQQRVGQIGPGLRQRGDRIGPRHGAGAEAGDLRKHVPHPVAGLSAGAQLGQGVAIVAGLGLDEPLQVERAIHGIVSGCRRGNLSAGLVTIFRARN